MCGTFIEEVGYLWLESPIMGIFLLRISEAVYFFISILQIAKIHFLKIIDIDTYFPWFLYWISYCFMFSSNKNKSDQIVTSSKHWQKLL